jgi:hypothetical protein
MSNEERAMLENSKMCEKHKAMYYGTCPACDARSEYSRLPEQHADSFDAGYAGASFKSVWMDGEAYNKGRVLADSMLPDHAGSR